MAMSNRTSKKTTRISSDTVSYIGDTWRIVGLGVKSDDGERVYAHLASATRFVQQRNGARPIQMADWIPVELVS